MKDVRRGLVNIPQIVWNARHILREVETRDEDWGENGIAGVNSCIDNCYDPMARNMSYRIRSVCRIDCWLLDISYPSGTPVQLDQPAIRDVIRRGKRRNVRSYQRPLTDRGMRIKLQL